MRRIELAGDAFGECDRFAEQDGAPACRRAEERLHAQTAHHDGVPERVVEEDARAEMPVQQREKFALRGKRVRIGYGDDLVDGFVQRVQHRRQRGGTDHGERAEFREKAFQKHEGGEGHHEIAEPVRRADQQTFAPLFAEFAHCPASFRV